MQSLPDPVIHRFLASYRAAYTQVIPALAAAPPMRVVVFRTDREPVKQIAEYQAGQRPLHYDPRSSRATAGRALMLITFSRLDGLGNSTLIRSLRMTLERRNRSVVECHMNHDIGIYAAAQALRDQLRRRGSDVKGGRRAGRSRGSHKQGFSWNRLRKRVFGWGRSAIVLKDVGVACAAGHLAQLVTEGPTISAPCQLVLPAARLRSILNAGHRHERGD